MGAPLRALRGLTLENPDDRPIPSTTAWFVRITTFFLVVPLAAMAVLYGGLKQDSEDLGIFKESFLALAHISYLCLVFSDLLLARPIYRIYRQTLTYPALLSAAYVLYAVSAYLRPADPNASELGAWIRALAYLFFILLYSLWTARDAFEWRRDFTRRARTFFSLCIDCLALTVLLVGLHWTVLHRGSNNLTPPWYGNKDSAVLFTLGYWLVFSIVTLLVRDEAYHQIYGRYLDGVIEPSSVALHIEHLNVASVLDVGCGDGRRTAQLLSSLQPQPAYLQVAGFDRDGSHRERYLSRLRGVVGLQCKIGFHTEIETLRPTDYNLIILSHFIYEPSALSLAIKILQRCPAGAYVIVRGSAPNSVFQVVSRAHSLRLLRPTSGHQWSEGNLQRLVREADLIPLESPWCADGRNPPSAMIKQSYDLNNGIDPLADLIGYLYGKTVGDDCNEYFRSLQESLGAGSLLIPNDDMIFILTRAAPLVAKIMQGRAPR